MPSIGFSRVVFVLLLAIVAIALLSTNSSVVAQSCLDECKIIRDNCIAGADPTAKAKAQCAAQYTDCEKGCNQRKSWISPERRQSPFPVVRSACLRNEQSCDPCGGVCRAGL
jgi:hypothetical protein